MKIVINAVSAKMGGSVSYITNLLRHLSATEGGVQFIVFLPPETAAKLEGVAENIEVLPTEIGHAGTLKRMGWEQITLRRFLKKQRADVLFSTANFGMFRCPVRQILLVRNALYFSRNYREMFLPRHSLRYRINFGLRRWLICRSVRAADVVMTPTRAMLNELRCFVDVDAWKALVNPYGVTPPESIPAMTQSELDATTRGPCESLRLLYVSFYAEHKNLTTLLQALPLLNGNGQRICFLRSTASPFWKEANSTVTHTEDRAMALRPEVERHTQLFEPLDKQRTQSLYLGSDIFVFPSLVESFGFPMVEAMSFGIPIVAADIPVNREICGDAALYFSPLRAEDLAEKVRNLAADSNLRASLGFKGRRRAFTHFSWNDHVRLLIEKARFLVTEDRSPAPASPLRKRQVRSL